MSALSDLYIKKEVLETLLKTVSAKGEKGVSLTISASDESNQYGQNVSAYVSQSKEDREAKKQKYYVGNGKVFWTDGKISVAVKSESGASEGALASADDLPF